MVMAMIDIKQVNFNVAIPPANNIIVCSNISTIFLFALLNFSHWQSYTAFWNTKQASITRCPLKQSIATCLKAKGIWKNVFSSFPRSSAINPSTRRRKPKAIAPLNTSSILRNSFLINPCLMMTSFKRFSTYLFIY